MARHPRLCLGSPVWSVVLHHGSCSNTPSFSHRHFCGFFGRLPHTLCHPCQATDSMMDALWLTSPLLKLTSASFWWWKPFLDSPGPASFCRVRKDRIQPLPPLTGKLPEGFGETMIFSVFPDLQNGDREVSTCCCLAHGLPCRVQRWPR